MAKVKFVPEGQHTITAALIVKNGRRAIEFYKTAFGAKELGVWLGPDGKSIMHAELQIGDTKFFLGEESTDTGTVSPQSLGGTAVSLNLYTEDCDATFKSAIAAGATVKTPLADQFWGDRYGKVTDPFGHVWGIATHKEDVSREEMDRRMKSAFSTTSKK